MAACLGRCSQMTVPGSLVEMTENGPRFCNGRLGLASQASMWLGPPAIQRRMTLFGPRHGRLLGQMLADDRAGELGRDDRKRPAILQRPIGLGVPGVDVAGTAGHPEKDDALRPPAWPPAWADARR